FLFQAKYFIAAHYGQSHFVTLGFFYRARNVIPVFNFFSLYLNDLVAVLKAYFFSDRSRSNGAYFCRKNEVNKFLVVLQLLNEVLRQRYFHELPSTVDRERSIRSNQVSWPEDIEVIGKIFAVNLYNLIALLESDFLREGTEFQLSRAIDFIFGENSIAHEICKADEDDDTNEDVDRYSSQHHDQPLPCWLAAEFPGFRWLLHGFGVERLVDHP